MTHKLGKYMVAEQDQRDPNKWYVSGVSVEDIFAHVTWHRDQFICKPFNIILDVEGLSSLTDFLKKLNIQGRIPTNPTDGYEKGSGKGASSCKSENLQSKIRTLATARKE